MRHLENIPAAAPFLESPSGFLSWWKAGLTVEFPAATLHTVLCITSTRYMLWNNMKLSTSGIEPQSTGSPFGNHLISKEAVHWGAWDTGSGCGTGGLHPLVGGECFCRLLNGDNELQLLNWLLEFTACHFEPQPEWEVVE